MKMSEPHFKQSFKILLEKNEKKWTKKKRNTIY